MKKAVMFLLAGMMSAAMLVGCGGSSDSGSGSKDASESVSESSSMTIKDGVLTMATNAAFPPYEYQEGGEIVGIDADIAKAVADKLGLELRIEDMEFDSIITSVVQGKADIGLAGMTVTDERKESVNFSDSYATGIQAIIVTADSDIQGPDDLADKKIGVQLATTGDIYAVDDYGSDHVEEYNKGADAVMALTQGKVDAVIIDNEPAKNFVVANEGLKVLDTKYAEEEYAAALNKENTVLLEAVNGALKELKEDGTLDSIVKKYIEAE